MNVTLIGVQDMNFTGRDGNEINGVKVFFAYPDENTYGNLYDETDDDDLIDAAEAAFDEYLAQCAADYSEACRIRAHKRS